MNVLSTVKLTMALPLPKIGSALTQVGVTTIQLALVVRLMTCSPGFLQGTSLRAAGSEEKTICCSASFAQEEAIIKAKIDAQTSFTIDFI